MRSYFLFWLVAFSLKIILFVKLIHIIVCSCNSLIFYRCVVFHYIKTQFIYLFYCWREFELFSVLRKTMIIARASRLKINKQRQPPHPPQLHFHDYQLQYSCLIYSWASIIKRVDHSVPKRSLLLWPQWIDSRRFLAASFSNECLARNFELEQKSVCPWVARIQLANLRAIGSHVFQADRRKN